MRAFPPSLRRLGLWLAAAWLVCLGSGAGAAPGAGLGREPGTAYPPLEKVLSPDALFRGGAAPGFLLTAKGRGSSPSLVEPSIPDAKSAEGKQPLRIEILAVLPWTEAGRKMEKETLLGRLILIGASARSLEGLEYWSASRKRMRLLYRKAHRIESPGDPRPLLDPDSIRGLGLGPPWTIHALLEDLTFGANVYAFSLAPLGGEALGGQAIPGLRVEMSNVNTIRYGLLPLAKPGDMASQILVLPCDQGIAVHFLTRLAAPDIIAARAFESAGNKALAVLGWFVEGLEREGLTAKVAMPRDLSSVAEAY